MLDVISEPDAPVVGFRARGRLTAEDYRSVLRPVLERQVAIGHGLRLLLQFEPDFRGWSLGALWQDLCLAITFVRHVEKVAVVGASGWIGRLAARMGDRPDSPLRRFDRSASGQAWIWLTL